MYYRTRTYIAGGWTENEEAVQQLYRWNDSDFWSLEFSDAHELMQARDTSLPCSIKESLRLRMSGSNTFVLIVGSETGDLRKGSCQYCRNYHISSYYGGYCDKHKNTDMRSFIEYECELAIKAFHEHKMKIIVLYDSCSVDWAKCPKTLLNIGEHIPMKRRNSLNGRIYWNYQEIKDAMMG